MNDFHFIYIVLILFSIFIVLFLVKLLIENYGKNIISLFFQYVIYSKNKIFSHKKVLLFIQKHPKLIGFIKERLNKKDFLGLPLTSLFLIFLYVIIEFIGITDAILDKDIITQIDIRLSDFFFYFKDERLIHFFLLISYLGSKFIVFLLTICFCLILFLKGKRNEIIGFISSISIATIIAIISKIIIHRARPMYAVYEEVGFAFPSFHASISIALYGYIVWVLIKNSKSWKIKTNLLFLGIIISFFIGLSRLYLNVHYLSDVMGGYFLGLLGLFFGITLTGYLHYINKKNGHQYLQKERRIITYTLIILIAVISFFHYTTYYYNKLVFTSQKEIKQIPITNISTLLESTPSLKYTETITSRQTEPINFIFLAKSDADIIKYFSIVGWTEADKLGKTSLKKMSNSLLNQQAYDTAPITPLYWNKRVQDISFQKLIDETNIKVRHHIRIWKSNYTLGDKTLYIGCGVYDTGIKWGFTHKIDPNLDKEREYIFESIKSGGGIKDYKKIQLVEGFEGKNFSGDSFFTDGMGYIVELK